MRVDCVQCGADLAPCRFEHGKADTQFGLAAADQPQDFETAVMGAEQQASAALCENRGDNLFAARG